MGAGHAFLRFQFLCPCSRYIAWSERGTEASGTETETETESGAGGALTPIH